MRLSKNTKSYLLVFNSIALLFITFYVISTTIQIKQSLSKLEQMKGMLKSAGEMLKSSPSVNLVDHLAPSLKLKEKIENLNKIFS